jgi:Outer membrane protein Omp28
MRNRLAYLLLVLGSGFVLNACDVVDGPKVDPTGFSGSTNKALIEDITGHQCGNCPKAHERAAALLDIYGDHLVLVTVHAGRFATVAPSSGYGYDFNTDLGAAIEATFHADNVGLPVGMVNRRPWGGSPWVRHPNWGTYVSAVLEEQPKLKITAASTYDPSDRSLQVAAHLEYFTAGNAAHYIVALVTEDSIVAQQADYSLPAGHVQDYVHNHVLRGTLTQSPWGIPVKGNDIFIGERLNLNFSANLDSAWVPENCHVVVYVTDNSSKEVLQVEEIDLVD